MPFEKQRGCGYRQVGKLYLVGSGLTRICIGLPIILTECQCCGFKPEFYRGFTWIKKNYVEQKLKEQKRTKCPSPEFVTCPVCYPFNNDGNLDEYGFMWVGKRDYTTQSFIKEVQEMGASKAVAEIPKGLTLGKTWVMLAHLEVEDYDDPEYKKALEEYRETRGIVTNAMKPRIAPEVPLKPGIFYAFRPERVEMPIWKRDATHEKILELEEKGITPIIWDDESSEAEEHEESQSRKAQERLR
jgi:hypothetical protein